MRGTTHLFAALGSIAIAVALTAARGEAHKPITSPYTFNEDVFPIVKERCGACHMSGGVAPMSLLTHAEAVPWGESMRAELMAGHMPPWPVDSAPGKFRNVHGLTARELNIILTWASGGTPVGSTEKAPPSVAREDRWPLGTPDLVLAMPSEVTLGADVQDHVEEFTIPTGLAGARSVRAVDLQPGTPAIVRSATVSVRSETPSGTYAPEQLLALWVPGDHPVPLDPGAAFRLPAGAELAVRVRYRKTWEYERTSMGDRSSVGLYFAEEPAAQVQALDIAGTGTMVTKEPLRALAIYPDPEFANAAVTVTAVRPDGSREELIAFRPRPGWARRYWFAQPIALPRGTRIDVRAKFDDGMLLPPGALPVASQADPSKIRLILNVVPAS